jgi:gamma-glutamyltranspeptidase / glutathione hydrolase
MTAADLVEHRGEWVQPLRATYRNVEVVELPPNTQGITALEALKIVEACGPLPPNGPDQQHRLIEAVKDCLVGSECVGPLVLELVLPNSSS